MQPSMTATTNCPRIHSFPHPTHSGWRTSPQMLGYPFGWGVSTTVRSALCPRHTTVLTENNSPNYFLALTPHPHQPARNACCLMASTALVLSAQTRHTSRVSDSCFVRLLRTQSLYVHKPYSYSVTRTRNYTCHVVSRVPADCTDRGETIKNIDARKQ